MSFTPTPALAYPHFETYRLSSSPSLSASSIPLPVEHLASVKPSTRVIGSKEARARAAFERVWQGDQENEVVYVDEAGNVVSVSFERVGGVLRPQYTLLTALSMSPPDEAIPSEYPSVGVVGGGWYLVSAGDGTLRLVGAEGVREYTLAPPAGFAAAYPFEIRAVRPLQDQGRVVGGQVVVSWTIRTPVDGKIGISYQLSAVDVSFAEGEVKEVWTVQAQEYGTYVRWVEGDSGRGRWIVGGPDEFITLSTTAEENKEPPSDNVMPRHIPAQMESESYPYSWTQTSETVTVTYDLAFTPGTAFNPNQDIIVRITSDALTFRLPPRPEEHQRPKLDAAQGRWMALLERMGGTREWWDQVRAERGESSWTFEWTAEGTGRLVFELVKRNRGVRWAAVFAPVQNDEDDDAMERLDTDVPESMSEDQIEQATERLDRWHSTAAAAEVSDETVDPEEEMEYDDDPGFSGVRDPIAAGKVGTKATFTSIAATDSGWQVSRMGDPVHMLSTEFGGGSVVVKSDVDGQVYVPSADGAWSHVATNPALAFVLASKRDTQYVHHLLEDAGATVIAFETGQPDGIGGNAYIYWPVDRGEVMRSGKSGAKEGRQAVVKLVRGDEAGLLVGVAGVFVDGKRVVVGLCERAWCVLEGI